MICKICNKDFTKLTQHLMYSHKDISYQTYYDTYLKKDLDGKCKKCGQPTSFINIKLGYNKLCNNCNTITKYLICKICNTKIPTSSFIKHINTHNILEKDYYDKYLKKENENICKNCKSSTYFINFIKGYSSLCEKCNKEEHYFCKICNKEFNNANNLVRHIHQTHNLLDKDYYDTYLKQPNEGICITCGKPTKYLTLKIGYDKYCSIICKSTKYIQCKICKEIIAYNKISIHIKNIHNISLKDYYDTYFKKETDGYCSICNKPTYFKNLTDGYAIRCKLHELNINKPNIYCAICNNVISSYIGLSTHIKKHNITNKEYYDTYLKKENDGYCKICNKPTKYRGLSFGYSLYCSAKCEFQDELVKQKIETTNLEKYGVKYTSQSEQIKNKIKETCKEKYGIDTYMKTNDFKEKRLNTINDLYGENYEKQRMIKVKQTKKERYDNENYVNAKQISITHQNRSKEQKLYSTIKVKQTKKERYGNENYANLEQNLFTRTTNKKLDNTLLDEDL